MQKDVFDITIIGAGPVGLFTAFYAGLRQAKVKLIDSLEQVGGQPLYLFPEKIIYDIPAFPAINGKALAEKLLKQLDRFDYTLALGEEILALKYHKGENIFELKSAKASHYSKTVILAAGMGAFSPKKLSLDQAAFYEDKNLSYYVGPLSQYQDKVVAICGGGDSAVDWALHLEPLCKKVYLIHRRDKFRAHEASVTQVKNSGVEIYTPYVPYALEGNDQAIEHLILRQARGDRKIDLKVDHIIVNYGFTSSMGNLRQWGLEIERNAVKVDPLLATNIPGVFAVGDIAHYPGKLKIIVTGFGEAPLAVNQALLFINPHNDYPPVHSSELF